MIIIVVRIRIIVVASIPYSFQGKISIETVITARGIQTSGIFRFLNYLIYEAPMFEIHIYARKY